MSELERWLRIELDRLGPHATSEQAVIELKTIERVLAFVLAQKADLQQAQEVS